MKLNVRELDRRGITVDVFDPTGRTVVDIDEVRVTIEVGTIPQELIDEIRKLIRTPLFQDVVVEEVVKVLSRFQIFEAIAATEDL